MAKTIHLQRNFDYDGLNWKILFLTGVLHGQLYCSAVVYSLLFSLIRPGLLSAVSNQ